MIPHMKFKNKLKQSKVFKVMAAVTLEGVGGWVSRVWRGTQREHGF